MLGDYYYAVGDLDKAVAEFASLHEDHPKDIRAKKNYVQLLILKNRLEEATKLNNEILKSNPHDVDGLICKGQIQIAQGRPGGRGGIFARSAAQRSRQRHGPLPYGNRLLTAGRRGARGVRMACRGSR